MTSVCRVAYSDVFNLIQLSTHIFFGFESQKRKRVLVQTLVFG